MLVYLRKKGFVPIQTLPDVNNPKYFVWRFEMTPQLEEAIKEYFVSIKK